MRRIAHFDEMMPHCNKHISVIMMEENHENDGKHTKVKNTTFTRDEFMNPDRSQRTLI